MPHRVQLRERPVPLLQPGAISLDGRFTVVVVARLLPGDHPAVHARVDGRGHDLLDFSQIVRVRCLVGGREGDAPLVPVLALVVRLAADGREVLVLFRHRILLGERPPVGSALQTVRAFEPRRVRTRAAVVVLLHVAPRVNQQIGIEEDRVVLVNRRAEARLRVRKTRVERDVHRVLARREKARRDLRRTQSHLLLGVLGRIERRVVADPDGGNAVRGLSALRPNRAGGMRNDEGVRPRILEGLVERVPPPAGRTVDHRLFPRFRTAQAVLEVHALVADRLARRRVDAHGHVHQFVGRRVVLHPHPVRARLADGHGELPASVEGLSSVDPRKLVDDFVAFRREQVDLPRFLRGKRKRRADDCAHKCGQGHGFHRVSFHFCL